MQRHALSTTLILALGGGASAQLTDDAGTAGIPGLAPGAAASLEQAYRTARRAVRPTEGGYRADHQGQRWRTRFDGRGFLVEPDGGGEDRRGAPRPSLPGRCVARPPPGR